MEGIRIEIFRQPHLHEVIELILDIQRNEFHVPITISQQPDLLMIPDFYQRGNGNFWVATYHERVVGTIGLIDIGNEQVALRKMFVNKNFRGKEFKTGQLLLDTAIQWMKEKGCNEVFLGTIIDRFEAAIKFYRKNGFEETTKGSLPESFPAMPLDNIFFKKEITNDKLSILHYEEEHQHWFEKLNREWIEKYFGMEPLDFLVLQHPDEHIIKKGGAILMACYKKEIAGTVALKFVAPGVYEFTKMAVDEKFRGKKVGKALAQAAITKARTLGASKVILYSNTVLEPAIALYRKIGFREVPVDGPYKRSNIKMELHLDQGE